MLQTETLRKKPDGRQGEKQLNHPEHMMNRDLRFEVKVGKGVGGDRKEKKGESGWKTYREVETELEELSLIVKFKLFIFFAI